IIFYSNDECKSIPRGLDFERIKPMISLNERKDCLLVDDDRDDQDIFKFALSKVFPEFRCIIADDGDIAMRILQQQETSLEFIVMDINLPRLNGLDCLATIRKIHELQEIPI